MVCMAVKTTLLVEIVIERNLPENWSSVSLLNIIAPPYLQETSGYSYPDPRLLPVVSLYPQSVLLPRVVAGGNLQ